MNPSKEGNSDANEKTELRERFVLLLDFISNLNPFAFYTPWTLLFIHLHFRHADWTSAAPSLYDRVVEETFPWPALSIQCVKTKSCEIISFYLSFTLYFTQNISRNTRLRHTYFTWCSELYMHIVRKLQRPSQRIPQCFAENCSSRKREQVYSLHYFSFIAR